MMTDTLTLAAFLLARIAEDEAVARAAAAEGLSWRAWANDEEGDEGFVQAGWPGERRWYLIATVDRGRHTEHIARHDPERVLAECEANRRIVENCCAAADAAAARPLNERASSHDHPAAAYWRGQDWVSRILALPYADHPDYRDEWKP